MFLQEGLEALLEFRFEEGGVGGGGFSLEGLVEEVVGVFLDLLGGDEALEGGFRDAEGGSSVLEVGGDVLGGEGVVLALS